MEKILDKVNSIQDLKELTLKEKRNLAQEIRQYIINIVSKNGGHLASNLGIVELTIALHSVLNSPIDKIVWDVGHQTYVHKILTGRKNKMETLRNLNGIAGFPKTAESEHDCFNTGHSSTSISVALGMARARERLCKTNNVIAVIGDGALTGGMAQEALNDVGSSALDITIILNDNEMSISKNVGGTMMLLSKLRTKRFYTRTNIKVKSIVKKLPIVGDFTVSAIQKIKRGIKQIFISKMYFEDIGFTYLGPVDGHDIEKLESILRQSKTINGPKLIHVITKKGKGYKPAEENPDKFHSTGPFNIDTGKKLNNGKKDYSTVFGDKLVKLAKENDKIVAVTAAMIEGTGLSRFEKEFSNRIYDVGIAEQHAVGVIAGMAAEGLKPVLPIYSSFLQRAYDQIIHDICIQNLPVVICIDRAGIVGNDGETHQGIFDLSYLNMIPNMNVLAPKDFRELENMLEFAINLNKPVAIRYPKGGEELNLSYGNKEIILGKSEILKEGNDITIVAIGKMVAKAIKISQILEENDISVEVINARFLKPLDKETILNSVLKTKKIITIEDNILSGGLATSVKNLLINYEEIKFREYGYPDEFIKQGNIEQIEEIYGLSVEQISNDIINFDKLNDQYKILQNH